MLRQNYKLFILVSCIANICFAAVRSEDQKLIEELTGRTHTPTVAMPKQSVKKMSPSEKHLFAGLDAFANKNYILALKNYNTVISMFPKTKEVRFAYIAKAKLYHEMGLQEQATLNSRMAVKLGEKISK
ncbi:hypothetical protein K2P97_06615 [bacterium]|nr:hypothetical protein [bacterium]